MIIKFTIFIFLTLFYVNSFAQTEGIITGNVKDKNTQETIIGALISVENTSIGTPTDIDGNFRIKVPLGTLTTKVSFIGYESQLKFNVVVSAGNPQVVNFELLPTSTSLSEVKVVFDRGKSAIATDMITPLSVQSLTTEEIKASPGGNFDVSKVIQTLPGVGGSSGGAQRNDIIIRGGAPNENVYYLDGVEIPVINHFQTQGSSGGAQGILNVAFIEDLKLSSSAFDAKYDNVLASTFIIKQKEGNKERLAGNARVSFTESVATLDGPLNKKTTFLFSLRKSYLDFLFKALDFPIRPNFYDSQFKVSGELNKKTTFSIIGIGAIDEFKFANVKESTLEKTFLTRSLPFINQWNYTGGFTIKKKLNNGYMNFILSRNAFDNQLEKYEDGEKDEIKKTLNLSSREIENKARFDFNKYVNGWKYSFGTSVQYVNYKTDIFSIEANEVRDSNGNIITPQKITAFKNDIDFFKYGAFAKTAKNFFQDKLLISAGIRTDLNSFTNSGYNPLKSLSPRISSSYHINQKWDINASVGSYFKIPTYTSLGFKNQDNVLINKNAKYIRSDHYVLGTQFLPNEGFRITFESFYKRYSNYPVSFDTGISLANQGTDFGSIGSERIESNGKGKTYGFELFLQQKLVNKLFYVLSYTFVRSEFSGLNQKLVPSSWDNRNLISSTLGYKTTRGFDLGLKYRYAGGSPYTPFDENLSRANYQLLGVGTIDYQRLNNLRLSAFNQLDFRVDKNINFKRTSLNLYLDIQNILFFKNQSNPDYTFKRTSDNSAFLTTDGKQIAPDGSNAIPVILENKEVTITPNIGFIFEF
ncbi:TonB-dependent receptor [Pedobacter psychrophilus]|uniref:TonB-dependent receptor n=1 Tax=Pedobacter psychrophilus TaxID=1826909 RepID=A0A179DLR2_9SPHI|nr:TonB-dependent receptor [Pedobacter psychrophilus]OAQ41995.1 TonB-dependent receptor [Pedobacter psychrophilus]